MWIGAGGGCFWNNENFSYETGHGKIWWMEYKRSFTLSTIAKWNSSQTASTLFGQSRI